MQDRFKFRIPMFTDKGTFMEFQYLELGDFIECTLCGTNGETQQCTGLKDKNGKLIYEGDIVKYLGGTVNKKFVKYITKWNDNMGQFYISKINPNEYDNWKDWHLGRHDLDYEVIGNIYENSELLEVSNEH